VHHRDSFGYTVLSTRRIHDGVGRGLGELKGGQVGRLSEALRDAFLPDELDELLYVEFDIRREDVTMANDYRARVFQLIRAADAAGWVFDLIVKARQARPRNEALHLVAVDLGLSAASPGLERILAESVPFVDVSTWRAQLEALEGQVCRVEIPVGHRLIMGTAFLVANDICLTNYHVIEQLMTGAGEPRQARLRFDFRRVTDGTVVSDGICLSLAEEWLVAASPPSGADFVTVAPGLPSLDELDFALIRVQGVPGSMRGWVDRIGLDGFASGNPLFLLQHPQGAPLKLSFGPSMGLNENATRLRHGANTEPGSSGSPCFNARLELVALHHAGDPNFAPMHKPDYNAAIPIRAILAHLGPEGFG
jgi:Trypsin-like peptidase domain/Effector-associated domain 1